MPQAIVRDLLLHYEQTGEGADLLILHGWGRSMAEWGVAAQRYAQRGFRVTLLDLPGCGTSEVPRHAMSIYDYADSVAAFLGKLGITSCTLIGHSLGGRIGTILAAQEPDLITRLVMVDSAGVEKKSVSVRIKRGLVSAAKLLGLQHILPRRVKDALSSRDYRHVEQAMRQTFTNIINEDLTHLFARIPCPTLVVWGSHDPVLPVWHTKVYARLVPDCTVRIVYEAGHDPHLDDPAQFWPILDEFLLPSAMADHAK